MHEFPEEKRQLPLSAGIIESMTKETSKGKKLAITHVDHKTAHLFILQKTTLAVDFKRGEITSDAGLLLIRQADNASIKALK